jgi:hypothetical protein
MEAFYKKWLEKNTRENRETRAQINRQNEENVLSHSSEEQNREDSRPSVSGSSETNEQSVQNLENKTIFENNELQLFLEKGNHIRQTRFRLQDHLFYIKIKLKDSNKPPPLLRDILEFLEQAFNFILNEIRRYYKPEDHNVAYLTLYQQPMICGLNTGNNNLYYTLYIKYDNDRSIFNILWILNELLIYNFCFSILLFMTFEKEIYDFLHLFFQVDLTFKKHQKKWWNDY